MAEHEDETEFSDDDALADALAAQLNSMRSGPIPVIRPPFGSPISTVFAHPAEPEALVAPPDPIAEAEPEASAEENAMTIPDVAQQAPEVADGPIATWFERVTAERAATTPPAAERSWGAPSDPPMDGGPESHTTSHDEETGAWRLDSADSATTGDQPSPDEQSPHEPTYSSPTPDEPNVPAPVMDEPDAPEPDAPEPAADQPGVDRPSVFAPPPISDPAPWTPPAPWTTLPAPDPAQAVSLPEPPGFAATSRADLDDLEDELEPAASPSPEHDSAAFSAGERLVENIVVPLEDPATDRDSSELRDRVDGDEEFSGATLTAIQQLETRLWLQQQEARQPRVWDGRAPSERGEAQSSTDGPASPPLPPLDQVPAWDFSIPAPAPDPVATPNPIDAAPVQPDPEGEDLGDADLPDDQPADDEPADEYDLSEGGVAQDAASGSLDGPPTPTPTTDPFPFALTPDGRVETVLPNFPQSDWMTLTPRDTATAPGSDALPDPEPSSESSGAPADDVEPGLPIVVLTPPPLIEPSIATPSALPTERDGGTTSPLVEFSAQDWPLDVRPVTASEPVPNETGSVPVLRPAYDEDLDDDVDDTDRAFAGLFGPTAVNSAGVAVPPSNIAPPSGPISTIRIAENESVFYQEKLVAPRVFAIEQSGEEPTPGQQRIGRASRLFWLWFASNSSIVALALGAVVFAAGMSLRQSIVAVLAGVALSFIPLALSTLAGKRSGQPTMIVSRASFGPIGNIVPAALALITRVFWGAVFLSLLASGVASVMVRSGLDGGLGRQLVTGIAAAVGFVLVVLIAFVGYGLLARLQLILSIVAGVAVLGVVGFTAGYVDIRTALTVPDGPWMLALGGAVLVFSVVGLVWANSGADLARYQRTASSGASSMLWASFGTILPTFVLVSYGAVLAASDASIAAGLASSPIDTIAGLLPAWYPIPLVIAVGLSLLSSATVTIYSGGFALQALGVRLARHWSVLVVAAVLGVVLILLTIGSPGGATGLFRDLATTLAVPTAAWVGIFCAETMIRNRRFETQSLLRRGGIYGDARWVNLAGLILISIVGFGLTSASVAWLSWQGYLFTVVGIASTSAIASTDLGVIVALGLGLALPIAAGIPAIRKQETARV